MPRKIEILKKRLTIRSSEKGHNLSRFVDIGAGYSTFCENCYMEVFIEKRNDELVIMNNEWTFIECPKIPQKTLTIID